VPFTVQREDGAAANPLIKRMAILDLSPDGLLSTTRAVRKRLDLTRPVDPALIEQCLQMAFQAPTGGNTQSWHFVILTASQPKQAVAALYLRSKAETIPSQGPCRPKTER
jgi:Nitroreductase family